MSKISKNEKRRMVMSLKIMEKLIWRGIIPDNKLEEIYRINKINQEVFEPYLEQFIVAYGLSKKSIIVKIIRNIIKSPNLITMKPESFLNKLSKKLQIKPEKVIKDMKNEIEKLFNEEVKLNNWHDKAGNVQSVTIELFMLVLCFSYIENDEKK